MGGWNGLTNPSFWKAALYAVLRGIGILMGLVGVFGGLIAFGIQRMDIVVLCVFFFVGGVLLSWYATFRMHTITIERGIRDAGKWRNEEKRETERRHKPKRMRRRNKLILIAVSVGIIIVVFLITPLSQIMPFSSTTQKTETNELYFQSTLNDLGGGGNLIMNQNFPVGEQKSPDLWHHPNSFLSPPLRQNTAISELTFLFYHKMTTSDYGGFTIKVMLLNANTGIQTICTESVTSNQYSRTTSCTITFNSNMPQLLQGEKLYIQIDSGLDWYWGSSNYPSHVTFKGVPQNEEIPVF